MLPEEDIVSLYLMIKNEVMQSLLGALEDYSVDNRGDVGSWVREAAMYGLEKCTYILCQKDLSVSQRKSQSSDSQDQSKGQAIRNDQVQPLFDSNIAASVVGGIAKQAVEKMDKMREIAARVLHRILYNETIFVPFLPHREMLEKVIPNEADIKWAVIIHELVPIYINNDISSVYIDGKT